MNRYSYEIVRNDRQPQFRAVLKSDGVAINLSGWSSIVALFRHVNTGSLSTFALVIENAPGGIVARDWQSSDWVAPNLQYDGEYALRIRGVNASGETVTFPTEGGPQFAYVHPAWS